MPIDGKDCAPSANHYHGLRFDGKILLELSHKNFNHSPLCLSASADPEHFTPGIARTERERKTSEFRINEDVGYVDWPLNRVVLQK